MKYRKFTIRTTVAAEDILSTELSDLGVDGIEIEDGLISQEIEESGIFYDELPDNGLPEGLAYVSFYLEEGKPDQDILRQVSALLQRLGENVDIGDGGISVTETADEDWLNNWKEFFHSFTIDFEDGESARFVPSWELSPETGQRDWDYLVQIDPGAAFGTGAHETTRLCIRALKKYMRSGIRFLDMGAGSGILSLMAFLFGAKEGIATDIDPGSPPAAEENFRVNGLSDRDFRLLNRNLLDRPFEERESFDLIMANILPVVLKPFTGQAQRLLKKDGIFITSGILTDKAEEMKRFFEESGFQIVEESVDGEWACIVLKPIKED
ncbi:MAG: 50S ribosomal protein L11 methyltransferase [Lachnospiraceae bacterium]|nr:50S ribosomal protein L11 methyltransferase [Lachnospiraceae bacterium]